MAIKRKLKADGSTGVVAIYTVEDTLIDDDPFTDPLNHVDRIEFHSELDYLAVSSVQTGTLSLPSVSIGPLPYSTQHNLFAHGLGYQPLVLGYLEGFAGFNVPLMGTTILYGAADTFPNGSVGGDDGWMRSVQLGADDTYVYLHEYVIPGVIGVGRTIAAATLDWRVFVTTRNLDLNSGNDNTASHPSNLYISPTRVVFGQGKFDTDRRHLKKSASGFAVAIDKSLDLKTNGLAIKLTQSVDGYERGNWVEDSFAASIVKMDAV